jgi:hypothetical protein
MALEKRETRRRVLPLVAAIVVFALACPMAALGLFGKNLFGLDRSQEALQATIRALVDVNALSMGMDLSEEELQTAVAGTLSAIETQSDESGQSAASLLVEGNPSARASGTAGIPVTGPTGDPNRQGSGATPTSHIGPSATHSQTPTATISATPSASPTAIPPTNTPAPPPTIDPAKCKPDKPPTHPLYCTPTPSS